MKKKIVFFSKNMNIGGMERALLILLNSFDKNEYEITLYLEQKTGVWLKDINSNVIIKELKTSNNKNILFRKIYNFYNRILWIINNKNKYDFSCNYATYSVIGSRLALAASKNSLLYVHSDYYNLYNRDNKKIKQFFNKLEASKFRKIAFVSNEAKDNLLLVYPEYKNKFVVLTNLFDYKSVLQLSTAKLDFEKREGHKLLIFIGRLEEESKNVKRLFDIMNNLKESKIDLIMIGGGKDKQLYEQIIKQKELTNVFMIGEKVNPYPYLKAADALILTSNFEGYPIVFSEAILLNKPIISTLKVSDKYLKIDEEYALIIKQDETNFKDINEFLNKKFDAKEVDFEKINRQRLNDITNVINGR